MDQVLDVRGVHGRPARIREIRKMAGRAMLDGPHDYKVADLEGPLLDLAVSKAEGLKAVIHKVDNAIEPFFECCVLNEGGRLQYQYMPSRDWTQGGPIIEREWLGVDAMPSFHAGEAGVVWTATAPMTNDPGRDLMLSEQGPTPLIAAMRCFVTAKLGDTVRM